MSNSSIAINESSLLTHPEWDKWVEQFTACLNAHSTIPKDCVSVIRELLIVANKESLSGKFQVNRSHAYSSSVEWKSNVLSAYLCARKNNSSIPSDILEIMRDVLCESVKI